MKFDLPGNCSQQVRRRREGFTLVQLILVLSIVAILSSVLLGTITRGRAAVRRAECDVHLKGLTLALDTFRQDHHRLPKNLGELVDERYIDPEVLRCPSDPNLQTHASDPGYTSYGEYYIIREPHDTGELPIIVCPFHEQDGAHGEQAYKGGYTKQFAAKPAALTGDDVTGAVTVDRPGQGYLSLPRSGGPALQLRGGDHIKTGAGTVTIRFADGSTASIQANSELTVLQSYVEGQQRGPLYTVVRQFAGRINYYVNPGSRFDVATPTATAGALGTRFTIDILPNSSGPDDTLLTVTEHTVALTTIAKTVEVTDTDPPIKASHVGNKVRKPRVRGILGGVLGWGDDN